ncbi:hypothetical protein DA718_03185 [Klebsiella huaxiensis]|nr:hypothetical protein DA718_03185 [Klebsiella huaxiensis]
MTHSELQGKIHIKLKIAADLGIASRVGFLFAPVLLKAWLVAERRCPFHERMIKRYNKCKLFR